MTVLNHVELLKIEKDGLEVIKDIERYGRLGFSAIVADDIERFKWLGLYQQAPKPEGNFMLRIKIPGGLLNATQLRTLALISREYGKSVLDITTRQALQFHWLKVESLPDIFSRLAAVGLSSVGAAGDCPRNVVGHPLAGIDADEVIDTRPLIKAANEFFQANREFSNLPRKFKIAISGSKYNTGHAEINDVALTPATKEIEGQQVIGFHVKVGGGLSRAPQLAQSINVFIRPEGVVSFLAGVATIFREHGYREQRNHARLKFLVADWGIAKFTEELLKVTGPLESQGTDLTTGWNGGYFYGVHQQKQPGLSYIGLPISGGRSSADEAEELARLAEQYGDGTILTTNSQNFILANIANENLAAIAQEELLKGLTPLEKSFSAYSIACAGKEFCPFALTKTKAYIAGFSKHLDQQTPLDQPLRIHLSGCPHSCAQPQIADIGLQGTASRINDEVVEAFEVWLGGSLDIDGSFATKLQGTLPAEQLELGLEKLVTFYTTHKDANESFTTFVKRIGIEKLQTTFDALAIK